MNAEEPYISPVYVLYLCILSAVLALLLSLPGASATTLYLNSSQCQSVAGGMVYGCLSDISATIADDTTIKTNGNNVGIDFWQPFSSVAWTACTTCPPSTSSPQGYGWATSVAFINDTVPAGMWSFGSILMPSKTATGYLLVDVWKNCSGTNTRLFSNNFDATNVLATAAATGYVLSVSQPAFSSVNGCYMKIEYWLNVTVGSDGATTKFLANVSTANVTFPTVIDAIPPEISLQSPENITYNTSEVWFNATIDGPGGWCGYSLDNSSNVTMINSSGNWNAFNASMADGLHNAKFYCNDTLGNTNVSVPAIYFTIHANRQVNLTIYMNSSLQDTNASISIINSTNESQEISSGSGNIVSNLALNQNYTLIITKNVSTQNITAKIINLNITGDMILTMQIMSSYAGPEHPDATIATSVFAFNDTGLSYEYATLYIPNGGKSINKVLHCTDWNFTSGNCTSSANWTINSTTDYGVRQNSTHFWFNASSFDGYGGGSVYLDVSIVTPDPSLLTDVMQNQTFTVNATVYCRGGDCGIVNGTIRYNASSTIPDTSISTTLGATPFYIKEAPAYSTKNCSIPLTQDAFCNITWIINSTGIINSAWEIGALFASNDTVIVQNATDNATVNIANCAVDMTVQFGSMDFGTLNPGARQSASGNANDQYNVTVNSGSCNLDLYIKSTDLTNTTLGYSIGAGNMTFSNTTNTYASSYNLSNSYRIIKSNVVPVANTTTYFWFNVPPVQTGIYTGNITVEGVKNGYPA